MRFQTMGYGSFPATNRNNTLYYIIKRIDLRGGTTDE